MDTLRFSAPIEGRKRCGEDGEGKWDFCFVLFLIDFGGRYCRNGGRIRTDFKVSGIEMHGVKFLIYKNCVIKKEKKGKEENSLEVRPYR